MGQISKGFTGASIFTGVVTGGILGTLAGKLSPPGAGLGSKMLTVSLATAVTAALAWTGTFMGPLYVLSGFMGTSAVGTVLSFAIEEVGQFAQRHVDARQAKVNRRYF